MDQTLIHGKRISSMMPFEYSLSVKARPHLKEFLTFCFDRFQNVSIWTAAEQEWFNQVNKEIFVPILESLGKKFRFVYTYAQCTRVERISRTYTEKRIRKLHKSKRLPDYTIDNTIIVDDTAETFRSNYGNAILIKEWHCQYADTDLLKLMKYIDDILIPYYNENRTIRSLNKINWEKKCVW